MPDIPVIASTQYGDFKGSVSIDGFNGPFLEQLRTRAKIPAGFMPVGFSLYIGEPGPGSMHKSATPLMDRSCYISVYASDAIGAAGGDALAEYARNNASVPVSSFDAEITLEEFFELVKRFHIVAGSRVIEDTPMTSPTGE